MAASRDGDSARQVEELVFECLECPKGERSRALNKLCARHPQLSDRLRDRFSRLLEMGLVDAVDLVSPEEDLPERCGEYRILRRLGSGGMGIVYLAEQESLHRRVALKLIRPQHMLFPKARERFRREVHAASRLEHPNICTVYEAGDIEGTPYIAMRYVEGETLAQHLANAQAENAADKSPGSRSGISEVIVLIEKVARALHAAHEVGLVHRDVKPGNIMVTAEGEPILLDFGLARDESSGEQQLTLSGDRVGTPAYMAPEQVRGGGRPADHRVDVYGLGATLYQCVTGRCPFETYNREELYRQILGSDPVNPRRLNPLVSPELRAVLEQAMEKEPRRRYQSALDFAEDLRRIREFEPIRAKPIGRLLRLKRWSQRHPAAAVAILGLVLALAIALGFLAQMQRSLLQTRALALATAAAEVVDETPALSLLLALEAADLIGPNSETLSPLHQALVLDRERAVLRHDDRVNAACFSPEGLVLTASSDGTAKLWNQTGTLQGTLEHPDRVLSCAFSPDGSTMLTGCEDGLARLWSLEGEELARLEGHAGAVLTVEFAPDGYRILTGSKDGTARLWDLQGNELAVFEHGARLSVATFSPDGAYALTAVGYEFEQPATDDFTAMLWSTSSGELIARLEGHSDSIWSASFSQNGDRILTASRDRSARLWDLEGRLLLTLPHPALVFSAVFHRQDGTDRILTGCLDGKARIWDLDGKLRNVLHHGGWVATAVASPSGEHILTASGDEKARIFDTDGALIAEFIGHAGQIEAAAYSPDGTLVLSYAQDNTARLWDVEDRSLPVLRGHDGAVVSAIFSQDQQRILTASWDGTVQLWTSSGEVLRTYDGHRAWLLSAAFSPDEKTIVSASADNTARLWQTGDPTQVVVLREHNAPVLGAAFSPDGKMLATSSIDGTTRIWDTESGAQLQVLDAPGNSPAWYCDFSPDGRWVVTAYVHDWMARIWDVENREVIQTLEGHGDAVNDALFSPDGEYVATTSNDGTARIWDLDSGTYAVCSGHQGAVMRCAFSPLGTMLATASRDGTARIWDLDGNELAVLRGHEGLVWGVSFSPDGRRLLTASYDRTVRTWIVNPNELLELAKERTKGREFTDAQLERFGALLGR